LAYSLRDGEVVSRIASDEEVKVASDKASAKLDKDPAGYAYAMRSCWVCNPAHSHFLNDLEDGFLFQCLWRCGHWYYQEIDLTGGPH
jgi:hypothetical protein